MNLQRIDHVAINVRDLQKTFDWYNKIFGFGIVHKWNSVWMIGNDVIKIGVFQTPDASSVSKIRDNIITIQHYAFLTDKKGFDDAVAEIEKLGIPHEPIDDTGIAYSVFIYDPDGHEIEITTYYNLPKA